MKEELFSSALALWASSVGWEEENREIKRKKKTRNRRGQNMRRDNERGSEEMGGDQRGDQIDQRRLTQSGEIQITRGDQN